MIVGALSFQWNSGTNENNHTPLLSQSQDRQEEEFSSSMLTIAPQADHFNCFMMITYTHWDPFTFYSVKTPQKWFLTFKFCKDQKEWRYSVLRQCTFIHHWWYKILGKQIANIHKDFQGTYPSTQKFHFRNLAFWYTQSLQRIFIKILFVAVKLKEVPTKFWSYLNWYYQIALQICSSLNSQPSPHLFKKYPTIYAWWNENNTFLVDY